MPNALSPRRILPAAEASLNVRDTAVPRAPATVGGAPPRMRRIDTNTIFETLRYRISTLQYPPGSILKEVALAEEFDISRTPIREVLKRLELAGLVQPVIGRGTIVTEIDLGLMRHAVAFRMHVALMLEHFVNMASRTEALDLLDEVRARNDQLAFGEDDLELARVAHDLRQIVAGYISNPFMAATWIDTSYLTSRVWFSCLPSARATCIRVQKAEIADVRESFARGDARLLATSLHRHISTWARTIWDQVESP